MPLIFLQYCPVGCKVSGNLSEYVFLLELDFAMINILSCNHKIKQYQHIVNYHLVVIGNIFNYNGFGLTPVLKDS